MIARLYKAITLKDMRSGIPYPQGYPLGQCALARRAPRACTRMGVSCGSL